MAGFNTHLSGGIAAGLVSATYGLSTGFSSIWQIVCLGLLGVLGGIVPDLDSDTGRPIKLLFTLVSSIVVVITVTSLLSRGAGLTTIFGATAFAYVSCLVFFTGCKHLTVHRGIMHSVPFALLVGVLAAVAASGWGQGMSLLSGLTAFSGAMVHLVLDELNCIGVRLGFIPYLKSSFGSALKFTGSSMLTTVTLYGIVFIFTCVYLVV